MIIERHEITGAWVISDIIDGQLVRMQYYDYTKREAMKLFREKRDEILRKQR